MRALEAPLTMQQGIERSTPEYVRPETEPQRHLVAVPEPEPAEARVIGLWGLSGSGKSETAKILETQGWARVSTSLIIGQVVAEGEGLDELFDGQWDVELYEHLRQVVPGFHRKLVTYAQAFQRVAGKGVWAGATKVEVEKWLGYGHPVVWENVRTEADYRALRALGGKFVEVRREAEGMKPFSHLDTVLVDPIRYGRNYFLANTGTLADLSDSVDDMLGTLYGTRAR